MVIDLKCIFANEGASMPVDYSLDMSDTAFSGTCPLQAPVTVQGSISNSAGVVSLKIAIGYEFTAPCDRCAREVSHKFVIDFERSLAVSIEAEESDTIIAVPDMKLDMTSLFPLRCLWTFPPSIFAVKTARVCVRNAEKT